MSLTGRNACRYPVCKLKSQMSNLQRPALKGRSREFGHFGGLAYGVRWLDSALLACGFDAGPDCRREQKLPTSVSGDYETCISRTQPTFRFSFGGAVKPAPMKAASSRRTPKGNNWLKLPCEE